MEEVTKIKLPVLEAMKSIHHFQNRSESEEEFMTCFLSVAMAQYSLIYFLKLYE